MPRRTRFQIGDVVRVPADWDFERETSVWHEGNVEGFFWDENIPNIFYLYYVVDGLNYHCRHVKPPFKKKKKKNYKAFAQKYLPLKV